MKVAVLGGHGKTGAAVCAALEDAVPLGRADGLDLTGYDALYLIAPNMHPDEPAYVEEALAAATNAGVERVVYHSVASPYIPAMPHHLGKAVSEDLVRRSGAAWTILQPAPYLQNFDLTRTVRIAYRADAPFGFLDLADLGQVAARVLAADVHIGATYELASRKGTVADLTEEVSVITAGEWAASVGADLDPRVRDWLLAMFAYYDAYGLPVGTETLRGLLGR